MKRILMTAAAFAIIFNGGAKIIVKNYELRPGPNGNHVLKFEHNNTKQEVPMSMIERVRPLTVKEEEEMKAMDGELKQEPNDKSSSGRSAPEKPSI